MTKSFPRNRGVEPLELIAIFFDTMKNHFSHLVGSKTNETEEYETCGELNFIFKNQFTKISVVSDNHAGTLIR